jgi:Tol biopolymer transport system component
MDVLDAPLAFSPDSTQLVFSRSSWDGWNSGPPALMAINVAGGGSVPLAQSGITGASVVPNDATQVQWSPDGNWVAYAEPDSTGNYFQKLEVAGDERARCACARRRHVGSDSTDLLSGRKLDYDQGFLGAGGPRWSPDGSRLLFLAERPFSNIAHIWTVQADGSHLTRRT